MNKREWLEGKMYTLFPEWVSVVAWVLIGMLCAFILYRVTIPASDEAVNRHQYYILQEVAFETMDGGASYVLEYARDGVVQTQAIFSTAKEREEYKAYLAEKGEIITKP